ncbi:sulfatase/phosphatase domain-containing protein [Hungatella sp.]|uniref:sulfatase/phosphatase domain-containing protein n=1 Tax=Hungatella sp. TaxID=2613924 RepID=UPI002A7F353E|nr:sulfatase/phosphatase domain-containing protein [Hungatella sp.]
MCHGGHTDKSAYMPEEIMRIPLAIRYPGVLPEGEVCSRLVSNVDLAPTVLAAAGTAFRGPVDGLDLLSLFEKGGGGWRTAVYAETYGHAFPHVGKMAVEGRIKYVYNQGDLEELYDLEKDPFEMHNLSPEKRNRALLEHMREVCREIDPIRKD